jgi:hypothetical protein
MNVVDAAARLLARARHRSVPIVDTYDIRADPEDAAFAIVPIRVVGEEVIQAVGYGRMNHAPQIVLEHHALSRRTSFLIPFAEALEDYLSETTNDGFPRIYLPNSAALELLTIMAARYENAGRNPNPNPALRPDPRIVRLGYICRLLKDLYHMPGQQLVVVMPETIIRHFVTGQIPPKDGHLGALTVWLAASGGATNTGAEADRRALEGPAAAMLHRDADEAIESRLHRIRKAKYPAQRLHYQREIEALQRAGVEDEWQMLIDAHAAFWNRALKHSLHNEITIANVSWLRYRLGNFVPRARRAIAMSQRYELHEYHAALHHTELIALDTMRFERERANGNAFVATILAVQKTPRGVNPKDHRIDLDVRHQPKIRLRVGQNVRMLGGNIGGEIRDFARTPSGYAVSLGIKGGINSIRLGGPYRWAERPAHDPSFNSKYYEKIKSVLGLP